MQRSSCFDTRYKTQRKSKLFCKKLINEKYFKTDGLYHFKNIKLTDSVSFQEYKK